MTRIVRDKLGNKITPPRTALVRFDQPMEVPVKIVDVQVTGDNDEKGFISLLMRIPFDIDVKSKLDPALGFVILTDDPAEGALAGEHVQSLINDIMRGNGPRVVLPPNRRQ